MKERRKANTNSGEKALDMKRKQCPHLAPHFELRDDIVTLKLLEVEQVLAQLYEGRKIISDQLHEANAQNFSYWKQIDDLRRENSRLHQTSGFWTDLKLWQRLLLFPIYGLVFMAMCIHGNRIAVRELEKDER